jgi:peptide/nickel transport system permease protein
VAAVRRSSWLDYLATGASLSSLSMPIFWVAIVAIWLFCLQLRWLPVSGRAGPFWEWEGLRHIVLPAATLATTSIAIISRLTRSGMLDVLGRDYVTTARAKGVPPLSVVAKHALKNALIPVVTVVGTPVRLSPRGGGGDGDHLRVARSGAPRHDRHSPA